MLHDAQMWSRQLCVTIAVVWSRNKIIFVDANVSCAILDIDSSRDSTDVAPMAPSVSSHSWRVLTFRRHESHLKSKPIHANEKNFAASDRKSLETRNWSKPSCLADQYLIGRSSSDSLRIHDEEASCVCRCPNYCLAVSTDAHVGSNLASKPIPLIRQFSPASDLIYVIHAKDSAWHFALNLIKQQITQMRVGGELGRFN